MKKIKSLVFIFCFLVIFQLLFLPPIKADDYEEFISSTRVIATVREDDSVDFQEIILYENPTNKYLELEVGIPVIWPYTKNNSQYSYYPFREWKYIKDANFAKVENFPGVLNLPLVETVMPGKTTGISLRAFVTEGILSKKNDIYTLNITGGGEADIHEIEVRIPLKKSIFPFFYSDLRIKQTVPFYPKQIDEGGYRKIIWDDYFYSFYHTGFDRNITWHKISVDYEYEFNSDSLNTFFVGLITGIIASVIVGSVGWIIKKKLKSPFHY